MRSIYTGSPRTAGERMRPYSRGCHRCRGFRRLRSVPQPVRLAAPLRRLDEAVQASPLALASYGLLESHPAAISKWSWPRAAATSTHLAHGPDRK